MHRFEFEYLSCKCVAEQFDFGWLIRVRARNRAPQLTATYRDLTQAIDEAKVLAKVASRPAS
jgi:hypothetical protein